ncbi:hypothetical protein [Ochrovirga pacifica]|uniref:hypothetical protein n=1 Tax=Ochrovirga pacifica TaxID=1042376 RepID=UPI000255A846|nr:hypothetical protein [Ochrovirga pacifica]
MKKPISLYRCTDQLDAWYLKNKIQLIYPVPVVIHRKNGEYHLVVSYYNSRKINVIVQNSLSFLPSNIRQQMRKRVLKTTDTEIKIYKLITQNVTNWYAKLSIYLKNTSIQNVHLIS